MRNACARGGKWMSAKVMEFVTLWRVQGEDGHDALYNDDSVEAL